jgi:hypothetical protein
VQIASSPCYIGVAAVLAVSEAPTWGRGGVPFYLAPVRESANGILVNLVALEPAVFTNTKLTAHWEPVIHRVAHA